MRLRDALLLPLPPERQTLLILKPIRRALLQLKLHRKSTTIITTKKLRGIRKIKLKSK
jgi:hypothetical protein